MSDDPKETFADGIDNLSLTAGAIRFDLVTIKGITDGKTSGRPELNKVGRVVMTIQAFDRTLKAFNDLVAEAEKQGALRRRDPAQDPGKAKKASKQE